jgi:hypothetical protein
MQNKFNELREKHPVFTYESYRITDHKDKLTIQFTFTLGDCITFKPTWEFIKKHTDINYENEKIVNKLAFNLGLVELISYWKCACSPLVRIKAGSIDREQVDWWKLQYFLGLGEFFYTNGIDTNIEDFMKVEVVCPPSKLNAGFFQTDYEKHGCLIPIGGGKDSNVTMELLSDRKSSNLCYMINHKEASERCTAAAGYTDEEVIIANRSLDAEMLRLNREGYLNGHTPFSAIVAFSSVLTAYLFDKEYVVLSNEASANESTVEGTMVNHQYSKSFKFESDFTSYEKKYISSGVFYFSLLRPFSELQIAMYFAQHEKYFDIFRSCNAGSKKDIWCGGCPKCLFVYIILSPFIEPERLSQIFGRDLLSDESLIPTFDKLIGQAPEKPFECVGTVDEANTAVCMTIQQLEAEGKELPKLFQYYKAKGLFHAFGKHRENPYIGYYNEENQVPEEFISRLKAMMLGK